jgi:arabinofuranosyltransferase
LGTLIRPELILMSLVELATLGLVVASPGWQGPVSVRQRYFKPLFAAICLPVLYELWRMAYFGLLVPNTALAKSSTAGWWNQGLTYLWNFVSPYTLWLPFIFAIPLVVPKLRRWWVSGDHIGSIVLLTPVIAALADTLYVVHLGGDFMHARLLLPAFLSLCVPIYIEIAELRTLLLVPVSVIVVWSVICGGWLRMGSGWAPGGYVTFIHGIANERNVWIYDTGIQHPISVADYAKFTAAGEEYNKAAKVASSQGQQTMLVVIDPNVPWGPKVVAAKSGLPFSFVVDFNNIGVDGVVAGPQVYLFDNLSLANPIGSHTVLPARGRPGHEKFVDPAWMVARFSLPGEQFPPGGPTGQDIAAARKALTCNPLRSYLHGITGSLSFSQAISNITHSFTYTRMSYSTNPIQTEQELCR